MFWNEPSATSSEDIPDGRLVCISGRGRALRVLFSSKLPQMFRVLWDREGKIWLFWHRRRCWFYSWPAARFVARRFSHLKSHCVFDIAGNILLWPNTIITCCLHKEITNFYLDGDNGTRQSPLAVTIQHPVYHRWDEWIWKKKHSLPSFWRRGTWISTACIFTQNLWDSRNISSYGTGSQSCKTLPEKK